MTETEALALFVNTVNPVYNDLADLVGLYVEVYEP